MLMNFPSIIQCGEELTNDHLNVTTLPGRRGSSSE